MPGHPTHSPMLDILGHEQERGQKLLALGLREEAPDFLLAQGPASYGSQGHPFSAPAKKAVHPACEGNACDTTPLAQPWPFEDLTSTKKVEAV